MLVRMWRKENPCAMFVRKAQEYWSGQAIPSPEDLPNPGVELGSPALQADSLPTELSGKPYFFE